MTSYRQFKNYYKTYIIRISALSVVFALIGLLWLFLYSLYLINDISAHLKRVNAADNLWAQNVIAYARIIIKHVNPFNFDLFMNTLGALLPGLFFLYMAFHAHKSRLETRTFWINLYIFCCCYLDCRQLDV